MEKRRVIGLHFLNGCTRKKEDGFSKAKNGIVVELIQLYDEISKTIEIQMVMRKVKEFKTTDRRLVLSVSYLYDYEKENLSPNIKWFYVKGIDKVLFLETYKSFAFHHDTMSGYKNCVVDEVVNCLAKSKLRKKVKDVVSASSLEKLLLVAQVLGIDTKED